MKSLMALGILLCLILFSCQNKQEQLKQKLIPIITNEILNHYPVKIDTIKIYKIDTISDSLYNVLRTSKLYKSFESYDNRMKYYDGRKKDLTNQAQEAYDAAHMELYTPDEAQFRQQQMDVYNQRLDEANDYKSEVQKYSDTLNSIVAEITKLGIQAKDRKFNKNAFLGYYVSFSLLGANKDNSELKLDSLALCISPNFRIMQLDKP